jgi:hypothetical protein
MATLLDVFGQTLTGTAVPFGVVAVLGLYWSARVWEAVPAVAGGTLPATRIAVRTLWGWVAAGAEPVFRPGRRRYVVTLALTGVAVGVADPLREVAAEESLLVAATLVPVGVAIVEAVTARLRRLNPNYPAGWHRTDPFDHVSSPAVVPVVLSLAVLAFAVESWAAAVAGVVWTATGAVAELGPPSGFTWWWIRTVCAVGAYATVEAYLSALSVGAVAIVEEAGGWTAFTRGLRGLLVGWWPR